MDACNVRGMHFARVNSASSRSVNITWTRKARYITKGLVVEKSLIEMFRLNQPILSAGSRRAAARRPRVAVQSPARAIGLP